MRHHGLPASKEKINRAGDVLRRTALGEDLTDERRRESLDLVRAFRAAHGYPLNQVRTLLAHHAGKAAEDEWFTLGQRLKQLATITDKLTRLPGTKLARMQDIGGCRVVFLDQATVDRTIDRLEERARRGTWDIARISDYVAAERADGYRAKHVIVKKLDVEVEIQLRTLHQHNWAELVEELDKATGLGLKQHRAPDWAVAAVAAASAQMRQYEEGAFDRPQLVERLNESLKPILDMATTGTRVR